MSKFLKLLLLALCSGSAVHGAEPLAAGGLYDQCAPDGVGVGGYDLVSYFESSGPESGQQSLAVEYLGYTYLFSSADNRKAFVAAPEKYLPRYRGWCATTLAMGRLACPDPLNYKIEDGSLLLFELVGFTNGRTVWETDPAGFRVQADGHARQLLQ
jgi:YHS domain-containing protein